MTGVQTCALPIWLSVDSLSYPLDGNRATMDADLRLTVGDVLLDRNPDNRLLNVLEVFQSKDGKPVDGIIEPLVVEVRKGQLRYSDFRIGIERQGNAWKTQLIGEADIDLVPHPPYARSIAISYPFASLARTVIGVIPNEDGGGTIAGALNTLSFGLADAVQFRLRLRGPLGEVDGRPMKLEEKGKIVFDGKQMTKDIGKTIQDVGKGIEDLFKKKK